MSRTERVYWIVLVAIGAFVALLHLVHLSFAAETAGDMFWHWSDTPTYLRMAAAVQGSASSDPMYQERFLLPWLMVVAHRITGSAVSVLWLIAVLELPTTVALGHLARLITGRSRVAWVAALLYAAYPLSYQMGILLQTDALHAQLVVMATAVTVAWAIDSGVRGFWTAGVLWILVQAARPTLFPVAVALLPLLWRARFRFPPRAHAVLLVAMTIVLPFFWTMHNGIRFGVWSASLHSPEFLQCWVSPYVRSLIRNSESPSSFTRLFHEEQSAARMDEGWRLIHNEYGDYRGFAGAYTSVRGRNAAFLREHLPVVVRGAANQLISQVLAPPVILHESGLSGRWVRLAGSIHKMLLFLLAAGIAAGLAGGGTRGYTVFFAIIAVLIMVPSALSLWAQARLRYPCDLLALPLIALAAVRKPVWVLLLALLMFGYLPRRLLGVSEWWLIGMAGALLVSYCASVFWRGAATSIGGRHDGP